MKRIFLLLSLLIIGCSSLSSAAVFKADTRYRVCFTPYQNCTADIVSLIDQAKESIYVQAYSFTSRPIARALLKAHQRGVKVNIIFDKSQFTSDYHSSAGYLIRKGIPSWNDNQLNIAHNKVMILDQSIVELGSFNYTTSAQKHNAENVLIIYDKALAEKYFRNWKRRQKVSEKK